jgi:small subunit ribosomal protein S11
MSEDTTKNSAEETPAVEPTEAPAPANTAPEAAAKEEAPKSEETPKTEEGAPKKDEKKDIFAEIAGGEEEIKIHKAKKAKNVTTGVVHVTATFNNTLVNVTDVKGNSIGWSSAGKMGFKGSRKSTAYAAQVVSQDACRQAMGHGLKEVNVRVKGPGTGREAAVRAVQGIGLEILSIRDVTPIPHNGCRPKKARRV